MRASCFFNIWYFEAGEDIIGSVTKETALNFLADSSHSSTFCCFLTAWHKETDALEIQIQIKNGDHNSSSSHLTRMDLPDVFASVVATMPATLPPNSSLENINQTSSSSPRSPTLPPHSQVASVFIVLVVTVIILGTVVGNVLVVVAVFTSRALRAPQNLFLVSLACADILVATLVIPFSLANEVSTGLDICILFSQGTTYIGEQIAISLIRPRLEMEAQIRSQPDVHPNDEESTVV